MSYDPRYAKGHRRPESEATSNSSNTSKSSPAPSDAGAPTPQGCPTCGGKGVVLWDPAMPTSINGTSAGPWTCPTCNGTRVLWSRQPDAPADRAAVSEDVAGLLKETTPLLHGLTARQAFELEQALRAATDRAEKAEAFANRWMHAAMYAVGAADLTLAFDPTAPESFAESRRRAIDALMAKAEATESRHATAIERVKQLPPVYAMVNDGRARPMGVPCVEKSAVLSILIGEPEPAPEPPTEHCEKSGPILCHFGKNHDGPCGRFIPPHRSGGCTDNIAPQPSTPATTEN